MPQIHDEGRIRFGFPDDWLVLRPETSAFYRRHFQKLCGGCKEMDFVLGDPGQSVVWLLEVKDYTTSARAKSLELLDEVALKVRDVLALLLAGAATDDPSNGGVGAFMAESGLPETVKVVLHLEQPSKPSKLYPGPKVQADLSQKLRQKLHCIDPHARVVSTDAPHPCWTSEWKTIGPGN